MTIQQIERLRNPYYKTFTKAWTKELFSQVQPYIEVLNNPNAIDIVKSLPMDIKDARNLFLKTWIIPGRGFAKLSRQQNKKSVSLRYSVKAIENDYFDQFMFDYAENVAGQRIVSIVGTQREAILNQIRVAMLQAEKDGLGAEAMARYIQDKLKKQMMIISRYSAERIARTEIVGASNRGQLLGAQSLGYNMTKTWLPFIDSATRTFEKSQFNHAITETVGIYDAFVLTGEPMQHPGDPKGSAGNVINCRCSMTYKVL